MDVLTFRCSFGGFPSEIDPGICCVVRTGMTVRVDNISQPLDLDEVCNVVLPLLGVDDLVAFVFLLFSLAFTLPITMSDSLRNIKSN
jgi:hypothetical protein